jgi:hypothetical protein
LQILYLQNNLISKIENLKVPALMIWKTLQEDTAPSLI